MKNRIIVNWRDVYDCKKPGEHQEDTRAKAKEAGYRLYCHNGTIWTLGGSAIGYVSYEE